MFSQNKTATNYDDGVKNLSILVSDHSRIQSSEKKLPVVEIDVWEVTLHVEHLPFLKENSESDVCIKITFIMKNSEK